MHYSSGTLYTHLLSSNKDEKLERDIPLRALYILLEKRENIFYIKKRISIIDTETRISICIFFFKYTIGSLIKNLSAKKKQNVYIYKFLPNNNSYYTIYISNVFCNFDKNIQLFSSLLPDKSWD